MNAGARAIRRIGPLSLLAAILAALALMPASSVAQSEGVTIALEELDVPGISGEAILTAGEESTTVEMTLTGAEVTGDHPTHIHTGTCDNFDPNPLYPLSTVILDPVDDMGWSTTDLDDATLDELLAEPFVIVVHLSEEELTTYLVCGEIVETAAPAPVGGSMPTTGVGTMVGSTGGASILALGVAAFALAAAAVGLRRRVA